MKHYEEEAVPATTRKKHIRTTCDLCRKDMEEQGFFVVEEVELTCRVGTDYPGGVEGTFTEIDLCTTCFIEKLTPWLESQGVVITSREY